MLARKIENTFLQKRCIRLWGQVDDSSARQVIEQLWFLQASSDPDRKSEPITLLLNSPGGSTHAGAAILDTMDSISCPIRTVCLGLAASYGALILMAGSPGMRQAFPRARIMIHQPHLPGEMAGAATDIGIFARMITRDRLETNRWMARITGRTVEQIEADTDRDTWMTPEEAIEYRMIDSIVHDLPF